jgi:TPR repeat protein
MENKKEQIIDYLENNCYLINHDLHYYLNNDNSEVIYNLLINNVVLDDYDNDIYYCHCGIKYRIEGKYEEMKKYYLLAIKKSNVYAMIYLAYHYELVEKNYEEMKKYYLMAIDKGNLHSMINLGNHYQYVERNYEEMKKYYLLAIENGYVYTVDYLIEYYDEL